MNEIEKKPRKGKKKEQEGPPKCPPLEEWQKDNPYLEYIEGRGYNDIEYTFIEDA